MSGVSACVCGGCLVVLGGVFWFCFSCLFGYLFFLCLFRFRYYTFAIYCFLFHDSNR